ncbi:MAG TPA: hypothetical protein VF275_11460 [Gammaproteobacteria bacterium]
MPGTITRGRRLLAVAAMLITASAPADEPSLMEMNDPVYLLEHSGPWQTHETQHFVFRLPVAVDPASSEVNDIFERQEANWRHLVDLMELRDTDMPKINYWLFLSQEEKRAKTKVASDAHSLHEYWSVYYRMDNARGAHELGHLFAIEYWGFIPKDEELHHFLSEGWAYFVDDGIFWSWEPHTEARKAFAAGEQYRLEAICCETRTDVSLHIRAVIASSFIKYLVKTHGAAAFGKMYRLVVERQGMEAFDSVYGKTFERLAAEYYTALGVPARLEQDQ